MIGVTQNGPTIILDRGRSKWAPMLSNPRSSIGVIQKRLPEGSKAILLHRAQRGGTGRQRGGSGEAAGRQRDGSDPAAWRQRSSLTCVRNWLRILKCETVVDSTWGGLLGRTPGKDFCRIAIRIGVRLKVGSRILWEGTMCDRGCADEKSLWAGHMCDRGRANV